MWKRLRRRTMAPSRPALYPDQVGLLVFSLLAIGVGLLWSCVWPSGNMPLLTDESIRPARRRRRDYKEHWKAVVDFTLTDEQKDIRELAHDFATKEIRPVAWDYDKDATWPQEIVEKAWKWAS